MFVERSGFYDNWDDLEGYYSTFVLCFFFLFIIFRIFWFLLKIIKMGREVVILKIFKNVGRKRKRRKEDYSVMFYVMDELFIICF